MDIYTKDLRIFAGKDLNDLIIVDNSVISFAFQIDNGFPILSFYEDELDNEFEDLIEYMRELNEIDDM
jgi:CTD small phosphatase-like protein 2